jgi:hypothetical protein
VPAPTTDVDARGHRIPSVRRLPLAAQGKPIVVMKSIDQRAAAPRSDHLENSTTFAFACTGNFAATIRSMHALATHSRRVFVRTYSLCMVNYTLVNDRGAGTFVRVNDPASVFRSIDDRSSVPALYAGKQPQRAPTCRHTLRR